MSERYSISPDRDDDSDVEPLQAESLQDIIDRLAMLQKRIGGKFTPSEQEDGQEKSKETAENPAGASKNKNEPPKLEQSEDLAVFIVEPNKTKSFETPIESEKQENKLPDPTSKHEVDQKTTSKRNKKKNKKRNRNRNSSTAQSQGELESDDENVAQSVTPTQETVPEVQEIPKISPDFSEKGQIPESAQKQDISTEGPANNEETEGFDIDAID